MGVGGLGGLGGGGGGGLGGLGINGLPVGNPDVGSQGRHLVN